MATMERLDLVDPSLYLDGVPREYLRWLRDHEPVAWHDEVDGPGYWVLSRYDDVVAANRDWERYSNALKGSSIEEARSAEELDVRRRIFVNQDPPDHTRHRKLVSHAFTPGHVRRDDAAHRGHLLPSGRRPARRRGPRLRRRGRGAVVPDGRHPVRGARGATGPTC